MIREQMIEQLTDGSQAWDVLVIGGGATGLGTALDAASRGLKTALVEAVDFAKGTSSRSTKLVHGGVRYLRQGQLSMVRDSLLERERLLRNAPHIVRSLDFVIPAFGQLSRLYYAAGMKAYDLLARSHGFQSSQLLGNRETQQHLPTLNTQRLCGGVLYRDGQFDDARLAIALAQTIVSQGGVVANYTPVTRITRGSENNFEVTVLDLESQNEIQIRARSLINATGVYSDQVCQMDAPRTDAADSIVSSRIVPSRGSHLVLGPEFLNSQSAMLIPETDDGRVLFAIPWQGKTLLGTTDIPAKVVQLDPKPQDEEVDYLLAHAARYLTRKPTRSDVTAAFAGLRPLVAAGGRRDDSSSISREHEIRVSDSGMISIIGGKWTTYRRMGEDVVNLAVRNSGLNAGESNTANLQLHVAPGSTPESFQHEDQHQDKIENASNETAETSLSDATTTHSPEGRGISSALDAKIRRAVENEMARTVEDVLARRTRILFLDWREAVSAAPRVAALMAKHLGRSAQWADDQVEEFTALARRYSVS